MIVDVHAHAASEDFIRETAAKPSYGMPYEVRADGSYATRGYGEMDRLMWDLDGRLENLHRRGIDLRAGPSVSLSVDNRLAAQQEYNRGRLVRQRHEMWSDRHPADAHRIAA